MEREAVQEHEMFPLEKEKKENKTQGSDEFSPLAQPNQQQLNKTHQRILYIAVERMGAP